MASTESNPMRSESPSPGGSPGFFPAVGDSPSVSSADAPSSSQNVMPNENPVPNEMTSPADHVPPPTPSTPVENTPAADGAPSAENAPAADAKFSLVKVFFGTDRMAQDASKWTPPTYPSWFVKTLIAAAATLFIRCCARWLIRNKFMHWLTLGGVATTLCLAAITGYLGYRSMSSPQIISAPVTAVEGIWYGVQRNQQGTMDLGLCEVSIPKTHETGELESPSLLHLEFHEDPAQHVMLMKIHRESTDQFYADLQSSVAKSTEKSALVFVHGFNVTFPDAVRRTAQIAYDLKFDGAAICFSWPSQGRVWDYVIDETNVEWSVPHLRQFLQDIARQSGARRIHLIAHSMGNRALTAALQDLSFLPEVSRPIFHEVVLTAPDIDADTFKNELAPAVLKTARHVTLYASSNDEALALSKKVHGYPRAGDSGSDLVVVPGMDTVDVSAVDTSLLGHSYYCDSNSVLADFYELLHDSKPADQRQWLQVQRLGMLKYWVFQR
jgi:esterase/lipase superfamily enzyme